MTLSAGLLQVFGFGRDEYMKWIKTGVLIFLCTFSVCSVSSEIPSNNRSIKAISEVENSLKTALKAKGLEYGASIFIRIFKDPGTLEVWVESNEKKFVHFKSYEICTFSGDLGPKLKEGDNQSPEGFYFVNAKRLNPWSQFHLSFNLGYPNKYDRYHGRTGSALMVHGNCVSIGCYAMTDQYINEIYALASAALNSRQDFFRVHVFPFEMKPEILSRHKQSQWYSFWLNLKEGYEYFENYKTPPNVEVKFGRYAFGV